MDFQLRHMLHVCLYLVFIPDNSTLSVSLNVRKSKTANESVAQEATLFYRREQALSLSGKASQHKLSGKGGVEDDRTGVVIPQCFLGTWPCVTNDSRCCCTNLTADCSSQGLTYIPSLPRGVTRLEFSDNSLGSIQRDTLANVTDVKFLCLDNNGVTFVHLEAFTNMTKLFSLSLAYNNLTDLDGLLTSLGHSPSLRHLNVSVNNFKNLTLGVLASSLPQLRSLHLSVNYIHTITKGDGARVSLLSSLHLGTNMIRKFPDFCLDGGQSGDSLFPNLTQLNLEWNIMTSLTSNEARCLPSLSDLNLSGNSLHHVHGNFLEGFPSLQSVTLKFCSTRIMDKQAFNHPNIRYLDVSENLWFFDSQIGSGISPYLFQNLSNLQFINMSWTVFAFSSPEEKFTILSSVSNVTNISLEGSGLYQIPHVITSTFFQLEALSLAHNPMTYLPDDTFDNMTSLVALDVSSNHLTFVSNSLLAGIMKRGNASINLSGNPFSCTCDLLWFLDEFRRDVQRTEGRIFAGDNYLCSDPESERGKNIAASAVTPETCRALAMDYAAYVGVLFSAGFFIFLLVVVAFAYRFRWQLRFLAYSLQHRLTRDMSPAVAVAPPRYDIFVSYDSDDNAWVANTLKPELEDRRGLKLCLHERDFTPGKFISQNIIEKMDESAVMMPLLSNNFLTSDWCRFELSLAVKATLKHRGRRRASQQRRLAVLPVLLEELQQDRLDGLTLAVLTSTTYLAWPGEGSDDEKERFWSSLSLVLAGARVGPLPSERGQGAGDRGFDEEEVCACVGER